MVQTHLDAFLGQSLWIIILGRVNVDALVLARDIGYKRLGPANTSALRQMLALDGLEAMRRVHTKRPDSTSLVKRGPDKV